MFRPPSRKGFAQGRVLSGQLLLLFLSWLSRPETENNSDICSFCPKGSITGSVVILFKYALLPERRLAWAHLVSASWYQHVFYRYQQNTPIPIAGTGTGASLCVSIPWECRVCAAQPKSCDQRGITWCTADERRKVGNWRELWKDMVGGCVQGRQQRGSRACCSSLRGWHLANGWVPFNRKIDYLSHYSQEQVTRNYIIR